MIEQEDNKSTANNTEQYVRFAFFKVLISKNTLKLYQQLKSKKFRQKYGLFVVEGLKSVEELLNSQWPVDCILCTSSKQDQLPASQAEKMEVITDKEMEKLSSMSTPPGILAIAKYHLPEIAQTPWSIALDGINDPGNLGTIIRIADWYGISTIYCSKDTVDLYNPKVLQASMGSFTRVRIERGELSDLLSGKNILAAVLDGHNIRELSENEGVILIGSEANGISEELLKALNSKKITIPAAGKAESLNAAVATAVICERLAV